MVPAPAMDTSRNSSPARDPATSSPDMRSSRRAGSPTSRRTWPSATTISRISRRLARAQAFSEITRFAGGTMGQRAALLVVDVQNDFCPGGALGVPQGDAIIPRTNRTIALFQRRSLPVIFTRDWHPKVTKHFKEFGGAWPPHCIPGTKGARFHSDLEIPKGAIVLSPGMDPEVDSYSGFQAFTENGRDLGSALHQPRDHELFICWASTHYGVGGTPPP